MYAAAVMIVLFVASILGSAAVMGNQPQSNVETIDPQNAFKDPRFTERGVFEKPDGSVEVRLLGLMYGYLPAEIEVPAGVKVTFRVTSVDVVHGFQIVGTNVNTMVVPGYVSQLSSTFETPGEYLVVCNEYCGVGHHAMYATVRVLGGGE